jgi:hypothetical protein
MMSVAELTTAAGGALKAPFFLPASHEANYSSSVYQPLPNTVKRISELAAMATTRITAGSLTVRVISRDANGADLILASVQKPTGTISTTNISVSTDLTLDHSNYLYFIEASFLAGNSSAQRTTLHWVKLRVVQ